MNRGRTVSGSNPMTLHSGPVMPRSVRYAVPLGQDPLVAGDHVRVRPDDHADTRPSRYSPSAFFSDVSSQWKSTSRIGGSGSRRLVEQPVGVGERVVDRLHVGAALEVDHRELGAVERVVDAPAAARDLVRAVVERPQDALARVEVRVDLALVPDVVAAT